MQDERELLKSDTGDMVLTTHRIRLEQKRWGGVGLHGKGGLFPVTRDHQERPGALRQRARQILQELPVPVPLIGRVPVHEEAGAAAMWYKNTWLDHTVSLILD